MRVEVRSAALCLFRRGASVLLAEVVDPRTGALLHRPPGGGIEAGETPEQAVRREVQEELGVALGEVALIGTVEHVWCHDDREMHERAFLFVADAAAHPGLADGQQPEIVEPDGTCSRTLWRTLAIDATLPPLCPAALAGLLLERA